MSATARQASSIIDMKIIVRVCHHHNPNENHDQCAENLLVQGMGMIAASLLLFLKEDDTFWMMACIVQVKKGCSSLSIFKLNQI